MNKEDIWNKVLDIIRADFTPMSFNIWFGDETKIYDINDQKVTLLVPMFVHKRTLLSKHYDLLYDAFLEVTGKEREIDCVIESEIKKDSVEEIVDKVENINNKEPEEEFDSRLNPNLTFENFVVGNSNKFARTAAFAVAENPGATYNPLFIYGKSGIGKTHLMHAIGNYIVQNNPKLKVLYTTSEEFRNDYTKVSNPNENAMDVSNKFKKKYRDLDVLMIDDIQFLVNAKQTQEEFFHTFNELHRKNKQIIITSDRSPDDLKILEERLRNRFAMGLPADIFPPDFELRCRIIKDKIKRLPNIQDKMTDEAIEFVASNFDTDVRSLEGAINRLVAYTAMYVPDSIDLEFANTALKDFVTKNPYITNDIASIQKAVADYYNITVEVLKGKRRSANIAYPRMVAMYLCRMLTDQSFPRIGLEFGGRDHSTVIHAVDKIEEDLKENGQLKEIMNEIKSKL